MKTVFPLFIALVLFFTGFSCANPGKGYSHKPAKTAFALGSEAMTGSVWVYTGGATSTAFAKVRKYWTIRVILVDGMRPATVLRMVDSVPTEIIVGVRSSEGRAVLQLFEDAQPWKWEGERGEAYANEVFFEGTIQGKSWAFKCTYPYAPMGSFLTQLRGVFKGVHDRK